MAKEEKKKCEDQTGFALKQFSLDALRQAPLDVELMTLRGWLISVLECGRKKGITQRKGDKTSP